MVVAAQTGSLPDGPGKEVVQRVCTQCHAVEVVTAKGNTRDGWMQVVTEMISRGAQGSDDDFGKVVDYLAVHFPVKVNVNQASAGDLQAGLGLGQKEAEAIVGYRKQHGAFQSLEDLKKVPGLDAGQVEGLKGRIVF